MTEKLSNLQWLILVRHGQKKFSEPGLTVTGKEEVEALATQLKILAEQVEINTQLSWIGTSLAVRAIETAQIIAAKFGFLEIRKFSSLGDVNGDIPHRSLHEVMVHQDFGQMKDRALLLITHAKPSEDFPWFLHPGVQEMETPIKSAATARAYGPTGNRIFISQKQVFPPNT